MLIQRTGYAYWSRFYKIWCQFITLIWHRFMIASTCSGADDSFDSFYDQYGVVTIAHLKRYPNKHWCHITCVANVSHQREYIAFWISSASRNDYGCFAQYRTWLIANIMEYFLYSSTIFISAASLNLFVVLHIRIGLISMYTIYRSKCLLDSYDWYIPNYHSHNA